MIYHLIKEFRQCLETTGFDITVWRIEDIFKHTGISQRDLLQLERTRYLDPLSRDEKGQIALTPGEFHKVLILIELHILKKYNREGKLCRN